MRQPPRLGPRTVEWTATTQKSPVRGPRRTRSFSCSRVTGGRSTAGRDDSAQPRPAMSGASSLRNLGKVDESLALLEAERETGFDELDDELAAFLALALTSAGREREAVAVALTALAPHLSRYTRSVTAYAEDFA